MTKRDWEAVRLYADTVAISDICGACFVLHNGLEMRSGDWQAVAGFITYCQRHDVRLGVTFIRWVESQERKDK